MKHTKKFIEDYVNKLLKAVSEHGSIIIGYDFDDTVHVTSSFSKSYVEDVRATLRALNKTEVCRFILITCREADNGSGQDMAYVEKFLYDHKLPYNAINKNLPWGIMDDPRKIYCNIMIDDKCGLPLSLLILKEFINKLNK